MRNLVFILFALLATAGIAQAGECCKNTSVVVVASCNPCEVVVCRPGLVKRLACKVQAAVDNAKARCEARKEARRKACACNCNCVVDVCATKVNVKVETVVAPAPAN